MKSEKDWKRACQVIHAMNMVVRSFNDEDYLMPWLSCGVPDDANTLEDIEDLYPNDEDFDSEFNELQGLFCRLIARQVKRTPEGRLDAKGILYVGQDVNA